MKKILVLIFVFNFSFTFSQTDILKKADSLLLKGNYQNALKLLENNTSESSYIEKSADIYQSIGDFNKSILLYKKALAIDSTEQLKTKLAKTYSIAGNRKMAIKLYEEVFQKDSLNLLIANTLGKLYLKSLKPKKAGELFVYLQFKDSLNPNYPYQIAQTLKLRKKILRMGQSYLDAYNLDTLHTNSIYELAKFFKVLKDRDSSQLFIDKGLRIDSLDINFLQLKANHLYFKKQYKKALVYLNTLENLNYKSINTYEMFGMSYLNLKKLDSAEIYFKKALKIDYKNAKILYRIGTLQYKRKNFKEAKFNLMMAVRYSKPDLDKHYYLLGTIYKEENNLKRAIYYFEEALKNNYKNSQALFDIAMTSEVYYKDLKIALRHYEKYIERFEDKDKKMTDFARNRIKEIRKKYFIDGEIVE